MKIGLIGNPNVGKSTIFNALTGLNQHTGNWSGKTVEKATGYKYYNGIKFEIEDLPGTYSLMAHSKEEEVTRDFVYSGLYDKLIVVCDATCLERNLNLVLQVLEVTDNVIVCINLLDEAAKKGIEINTDKLEEILNVPVIKVIAKKKEGIDELLNRASIKETSVPYKVKYDEYIKKCIDMIKPLVNVKNINKEAVCLKLLGKEEYDLKEEVVLARNYLYQKGIPKGEINNYISEEVIRDCEDIAKKIVKFHKKDYSKKDRLIDKFLTGKITGFISMLCLLMIIFWITINGANYPSSWLYNFLFSFEDKLISFLEFLNMPDFIINPFVFGIYRVLAWVVSVMLPPMAIFFPLFTLLEDLGYLPRIAFNLDNIFKKCASCGKQALTMAMGFGCNAVGVTGARIIDSKRERLMAILTNSFVPCNGRFPILISLITMFLVVNGSSILSALLLTFIILIGIIVTFIISKLLSMTLLKGEPSAFTLELPPFRKPQISKVIIRSILDRTLFVLKRAICVSAPAGLVIWLMANIDIEGASILKICSDALDPFGRAIGMDGVILMAFILGFPANEIVIPIMIMGYMSLGYITDFDNLYELKNLLIQNGWTSLTAISTMIFTLMHFPCFTTVLMVKKETGSNKWALFSILIPLITGIIICFIITKIYYLF